MNEERFNIYYIEDTQDDYSAYYTVLSHLRGVNVMPAPGDWQNEIDDIKSYIDDPGKNKQKIVDFLGDKHIDLFIIDEKISTDNSAGTMIYKDILKDNSRFPNLKVIIFTRSDPAPELPGVDKECLRVSFKYENDVKSTSEELLLNIKRITGLEKNRFTASINVLLNELEKIINQFE